MPVCTVAVRALCEFAAKRGDLDLRFTPAPTAREGMQGHVLAASRRGPDYQAEVSLSGDYQDLAVRGRADGWNPVKRELVEVKTHRGSLERQPRNHRDLHWAQARVYGWLMCLREGLDAIDVALVYVNVDTRDETVFVERCPAAELQADFERCCAAYLGWARDEAAHRAARDAALSALRFPHAAFRAGQRELAAAVYRAARAGRCLMAQAPTGIGKTVATLFPMLKAAPAERLDRMFFLTAKTSGRALALGALDTLRGGDAAWPVRTLELVARDKACEHPDRACHGDSCPLARGFYDRLPQAREAARAHAVWDRDTVRKLAREHRVCPYYLGQELARWSDVVVGDHNHWFDAGAMLHGLAQAHEWRVGVLVDEAHNLLGRARAMYSASLDRAALKRLRREVPPAVARALDGVRRRWTALERESDADWCPLAAPPAALLNALQKSASAIGDHLAEQPPQPEGPLQAWWFDTLHLLRLAESFGTHSLFDLTRGADGLTTLNLRNVEPAPFLAPRFATAHTATLFSATLQPPQFHRHMLGLPDDTRWIDVDTPFERSQLAVHVDRGISTRWRDRDASLARVVARIAAQYDARPGNYLAFFGSHDYLQRAADAFEHAHPGVPAWRQSRGMPEAEQAAFLGRFVDGGRGIGFAVLGGSFAEGVDLPGERLVGAFIATLGLPATSPLNEEIRRRLGFEATYLYPGLQKVVQAAGRVIRTANDRGVLHLLDDRFLKREVRALLPAWWGVTPSPASGRGWG
jgi:DNA excision repair protein ERCC-2